MVGIICDAIRLFPGRLYHFSSQVDLAHPVDDRGVVLAAEMLTDHREGYAADCPQDPHRHEPGLDDIF